MRKFDVSIGQVQQFNNSIASCMLVSDESTNKCSAAVPIHQSMDAICAASTEPREARPADAPE